LVRDRHALGNSGGVYRWAWRGGEVGEGVGERVDGFRRSAGVVDHGRPLHDRHDDPMEDAVTDVLDPSPQDNPLSSAQIRYTVQVPVASAAPGPRGTRPFGLLAAQGRQPPASRWYSYCHDLQVAVDEDSKPLIESMGKKGKEWKSKSSTDGDEGPEENWGWEEK
jgi:putative ATP-grasp target RiPP